MSNEGLRKPLFVPAGLPILLRDIVHERTGIFFESDRCDLLLEKLDPLARQRDCHSFLDYYYILKYNDNGVEDWIQVAEALSVQETYFCREVSQIKLLVDVLIPQWFRRHSIPFRIWSAACASGEEPYSIVMALLEAGWAEHPIEIYASDASPSALEKAQAGVYREKAFRQTPPGLREKYFIPTDGGWRISEAIAKRVKFQRANLLATEEFSSLARSNAVFCRNVFIYFSAHAIRQTLAAFASRMPVNSHLFVGAAESLLKLTGDFELREISETFVYVRI
jgi:chemotaxis protein methyltransferase CheR